MSHPRNEKRAGEFRQDLAQQEKSGKGSML
jgi:hypothetical protein